MRLNLTFATSDDANNFLTKTGETDITNIHVGLINTAVNSQGFVSGIAVGDAIEFLVKQSDGTWTTETIQDPFARISAGSVIEPSEAPIKMLSMDTWGQTRIANRYLPLVENLIKADYAAQRRVEVIVVDSGINTAHQEFADATIENLYKVPAFDSYADELMHGTFISSLIVGKTLGVNKQAVIKNVKISSSSRKSTLGELGTAFDAILAYHATCPAVPKIANLSWRIPRSAYIDSKINSLIEAGVMVVAAAGNTAMNIDEVTPAGTTGTFTVAGSTYNDSELCGVYGTTKKLSIYAPGENITGAKFDSNDQFMTSSGSSYSAAFASAVASMHFGFGASCPTASTVVANIIGDSTPGALNVNDSVTGLENRLLHSPDASTIANDVGVYIGNYATFSLKQKGHTYSNIKNLFPSTDFQPTSYSLEFDDQATALALAFFTIENGDLIMKLGDNYIVDETSPKIKQFSFKVKMTSDGLSMTSPTLYIIISSGDIDYLTEIAPVLELLESTVNLEYQGLFGGGFYPYGSKN